MSNATKYTLTDKGSVTSHDKDGNLVSIGKGEQITRTKLKALPKRQQKYFTKVEAEVEEKAEVESTAEDLTVEELQDALQEAEVDYKSSAKKAELVALYEENVSQ